MADSWWRVAPGYRVSLRVGWGETDLASRTCVRNTVRMSPRRALDLPADWPGWSDARPVAESDTLPDTHEHVWRIGWLRVHAQWQDMVITARRRTVDGGWAAHAAWGLGEVENGWIRWNDRTVRIAEPPKE